MMKKITLILMGLFTFVGISSINAQTILFGEDFVGGVIPATWQNIDNTTGGGTWVYTTAGGAFGGQLASTSAANGYVMFDSDGFGNDLTAENADLITPSFSTLGETSVRLQFQEFFRAFATPTGTVSVRSNNGAWNVVYTVTADTPNPNVVDLDISAFAANSANVQVKFNYVGDYDYWWLLDDIYVYALPQYDAGVAAVNISEYSAIPLTHVTSYTPSTEVENIGVQTVTGISVTTTIFDGAQASVYTATTTQASLASGASTTLTAATAFVPTAADFYLVESIVSITEADGNSSNDTLFTALEVNDSTFARDFYNITNNTNFLNGGSWFGGSGNDAEFGNIYTPTVTTDLVSATAFFNGGYAIGDQVQASIYNMAGGVPTTLVSNSNLITVTAADTPVLQFDIPFPTGVSLTGGSDYFLSVKQFATSADNFGIFASNSIYTPTTSFVKIGTGAWIATDTTTIGPVTFVVWANVHEPVVATCSISDVTAGVQTTCDPLTNTYTQEIIVTYTNAPTTGSLDVYGQTFPILSSPQVVTLTGLPAGGLPIDVTAFFTANSTCNGIVGVTPPASCTPVCNISDITAGTPTACDVATNTYSQDVSVTFSDAPATGTLDVNGQSFTIGTSPQTVTLTNLPSDGLAVDVTASFSADATCTLTSNALFTAPASCLCPTINVNVTTNNVTNCTSPDGSVTALATGGTSAYTYAWTPGGSGATLSNIPSGNYAVVATDANGCTGTAMATVSNASGFTASLNGIPSMVTCNGGTDGVINTQVSGGSGNYTYNWSDVGSPTNVANRTNLSMGSYSVLITDVTSSCTFTLGPISITEPDALVASVVATQNVTCNGGTDGSIDVMVTGGNGNNTYAWTNGGGSAEDANNLSAGSYTLTVTDAGCPSVSTNAIVVSEPNPLTITFDSDDDVSCFGEDDGNVFVTVTGGNAPLTYSWTNGGGSAEDAQNLGGGSYQLTITDNAGCPSVSSAVYNISEPTEIVISILDSNDETCFGENDGTITADITGGTGAMNISWTNTTSSSLSLTGLAPNSYQMSVTDGNNCPANSPIVTIASASQLTTSTTSTPETSAGNDGTATVVASGGTGSYTYLWTPSGQTTSAASGLSTGIYTCVVKDENDCSTSVNVEVSKSTAIGEIALNELAIYPNPSNGTFTVSFETVESLDFEISIFNTIGKEVYTNSFNKVIGSFNEQIETQDLTNGIYFLEISNKDAKSVNKITINK